MLTVALTGGIACGKSVVAKILEEKGCFVQSADLIAHELLNPGTPAWEEVAAHFGPGVLNPDKTVNRGKLGSIVFADEKELRRLNAIIHPRVLEKEEDAIRDLESKGRTGIYVSEAALTIEAGFQKRFDKIVVVFCAEDVQIQRLMARDGIGRPEALRKIRSQMPVRQKLEYADYTVDTSGPLAETVEQAERLFAQLSQDALLKKKTRSRGAARRGRTLPR